MLQEIAAKRLAKLRSDKPPDISSAWSPHPGPQTQFWDSTCREILYGGAAGGGKSAAITALPLKWVHLPEFEAVILRRETTQLDDLIQKSEALVPKVFPGLNPTHSPHFEWKFPSGAKLKYRHCQRLDDYKKFDGWEINLLCFDELTHFTEKQYKYICARVRSPDRNLPTYIRASTNPGGPGHEWVMHRWRAWLVPGAQCDGLEERSDGKSKLPPAKPGEVLWIRTEDGKETYYREDPGKEPGRPAALTRTFIPAQIEDNPAILEDEAYLATLEGLDAVRRRQLRGGDWLVKPAAGLLFKRGWVQFVDSVPRNVRRVRAWDLAATLPSDENPDPDWTVGALLAVDSENTIYVENIVRDRTTPGAVRDLIVSTAELDPRGTVISIPQDPGQAGKSQVANLMSHLVGHMVESAPVTGDKVTRFGPFSSSAEHGMVKIVRGDWNKALVEELESFPTKGIHDDQADAVADAFRLLTESGAGRFLAAMEAIEERGGLVFA